MAPQLGPAELCVWVLNLDAEYELANLTMPASKLRDIAKFPRTKFPFLRAHDQIIGRGTITAGLPGFAWCPTPRALRQLGRVGARLPDAPSVSVLRAVNHRCFAEALGWPLPNTVMVSNVSDALQVFGRTGRWCVKRPLSAAGHGKRFIDGGELSQADLHWIEASLRRQDSVLIEPRVEITLEFSIHGYIEQQGNHRVGQTMNQETRELIEGQLTASQHACVKAEVTRVAEALRAAGYFGPFGIDGYIGSLEGEPVFVPRSEINARYTMNYPAELLTRG